MSYYRYADSSYYRPSLFGGFKFFPPVIKTLIISNISVYVLTWFLGRFTYNGTSLDQFIGSVFFLYPLGHADFHLWQLITYMFEHGGLLHLLFNMFALWMFGMELENVWGSRKFLSYYLICGVGAGVSNLLIGPLFGPSGPTVGASGAIYGVLIAFGMMFPDRPIFVYFLLPIRARYFVLLYILLELYAGVTSSPDGVAHFAHLGGAAVGYAYLLIDQRRWPFRRLFDSTGETGRSPSSGRFVVGGGGEYSRFESRHISDAQYHDLHETDERISQQRIDEILDKISQNGYQSLSENEKKILFEASKKLN